MLPTPDTSHINYSQIYEPSEDSYLLLDTLSSASETTFLTQQFTSGPSPLVCEVGTGSGVVLAFIAANATAIFGRGDVLALGTDLNGFACAGTAGTVRYAVAETVPKGDSGLRTAFLGALNADLVAPLRHGSVDVLVFNPPYVPAPLPDQTLRFGVGGEELSGQDVWDRDSHLLALSYAGGEEGMEVTNRLLEEVPRVLSPRGVAYVLLCAQNKPLEVAERLRASEGGWKAELVGSSGKQAGWEKLVILRIWRP